VLSRGEQNSEPRWSKVNLGECPLATRTLTSQLPECRTPKLSKRATWAALRLRGPTLPRPLRDFADRGILGSKPFAVGVPDFRIPDTLDSCHLSLQESTVPIKSRNRPSRFQRAWDSCTPQLRFADMRWPKGSFAV
jgi:hypothetical protein